MGLLCCLKIMKTSLKTERNPFGDRLSGIIHSIVIATSLLLPAFTLSAQPILDKTISLPRQHTTLYDALNIISQKAGCLFVYDSQIVENDRKVKLVADNQPLRQVLDKILANPELTYKVIGQHILIYKLKNDKDKLPEHQVDTPVKDSIKTIVIKGYIFDEENKSTLSYVSVGILEENIGTISNNDGFFTLKVPAGFAGSSLIVSHIGYMSQYIPIRLIREQKVDIYLKRRIISIQEVIIRYFDPKTIVEKAMDRRKINNNREPVYTTSFYREGVQKNNRYLSYSEAVFKVYKSPYTLGENFDQVKMLKSRKVQNPDASDTVFLKLKSGVLSALQLDIVKCVPGFLDQTLPSDYIYTYSDLVSHNSTEAYAITFVQKKEINDALYKGTLYIDKENFAVLGADFEINPAYLEQAAEALILKKSPKLIVKLEKINYSISYSSFGEKYYLNHVRCEIQLKTRLRNRLSYDNFKTFLELATCSIDTSNVEKFARQDVIRTNVVFSDAPYTNDDAFWSDFNVITPEAKLTEELTKIIGKIEKME